MIVLIAPCVESSTCQIYRNSDFAIIGRILSHADITVRIGLGGASMQCKPHPSFSLNNATPVSRISLQLFPPKHQKPSNSCGTLRFEHPIQRLQLYLTLSSAEFQFLGPKALLKAKQLVDHGSQAREWTTSTRSVTKGRRRKTNLASPPQTNLHHKPINSPSRRPQTQHSRMQPQHRPPPPPHHASGGGTA